MSIEIADNLINNPIDNKIVTQVEIFPSRLPITLNIGGSILFAGNATSNLSVANDEDLRFRTGDFTIEWFQYQTDNNPFPRIFSIGSFPTATISVSIEGSTLYFWANGSVVFSSSAGSYKNQWVHFAVTRSGSNLRIFKNGSQLGSTTNNNTDFNDTTQILRISNQSTTANDESFGGNITNFRWIKGTAVYTSDFTTPASPLTPVANTKLLLLAANATDLVKDSSDLNKTVTNNSTTFSTLTPFS
jgi:hypothetical protein